MSSSSNPSQRRAPLASFAALLPHHTAGLRVLLARRRSLSVLSAAPSAPASVVAAGCPYTGRLESWSTLQHFTFHALPYSLTKLTGNDKTSSSTPAALCHNNRPSARLLTLKISNDRPSAQCKKKTLILGSGRNVQSLDDTRHGHETAKLVNKKYGTAWDAVAVKSRIAYSKKKYDAARKLTEATGAGDTEEIKLREEINDFEDDIDDYVSDLDLSSQRQSTVDTTASNRSQPKDKRRKIEQGKAAGDAVKAFERLGKAYRKIASRRRVAHLR
ncbi:hypothetical protein BC939DRAFT_504180 [Gamsiella multidivaricata]|uniref:uncharacterized protein n=1 Tax=Gamsiella multidivaricata TaxID=101098 RepID=UPI00221E5052|nr:uncharacterized protein BC939DRAFT_504180 [Gamsiella multidivaricata]KAI7821939.1 hypothetical protein BC939DRAFT_504180 [Gamsiella multidivaricata]